MRDHLKKKIKVLGIMSGTSIDGVDMIEAEIKRSVDSQVSCKMLRTVSVNFPTDLRKRLIEAASNRATSFEVGQLNSDLGRFYAKAVSQKFVFKKLDLIGLHGQTIYHKPQSATFQIGEPTFLAKAMGCPVVSQLRSADVVEGGHGAPLAPVFHERVLWPLALGNSGKNKDPIGVLNLGGIANITYLSTQKKLAFDIGPANILLDLFMQTSQHLNYDKNGKLASQGLPDIHWVHSVLTNGYFKVRPPKSTGRELFGPDFFEQHANFFNKYQTSPQTIAASLVELTAISIAKAVIDFLPKVPVKIFCCGGGAKNKYLMSRIQYHLPMTEILKTEQLGWPTESIEGGAFALLAALRFWQLKVDTRSYTNAKNPTLLGQLTLP